MTYQLRNTENDCRGKVFLIYDVLSHFKLSENIKDDHSYLKVKKITQYKGHLTNLTGYKNFEDFFSRHFSAKSRSNIKKWDKRLKTNFNTNFKVFYGTINLEEYNHNFDNLLNLIKKRWNDLGMENDIITNQDYYRELCYNMILDQTASLNVLYANDEIVATSICFASKKELYFAITTFDIDFRKYNLGHLLIMYIMDWCFENGFETFDYSKGTYEYKTRWSNTTYDFEHHILYDRKSVVSSLTGNFLVLFFKMKQFLRDKDVNILYSKIKYLIHTLKLNANENQNVNIKDLKQPVETEKVESIPLDSKSDDFIKMKPIVYDIIFSNPQPFKTVKVYKGAEGNKFIVEGEKFLKEVTF
ncbi:hypothetical protein DHD08_06490 [Arenibacter sp. H213]|uniref:GNAT family N-acetyltransferase n=2 Tax=Arenibacter antarcticus TaxID=2040469 RepID=A0ABW5VJT9_9FLAO|nr:GNAT family N-acetyltransferase [Arenibacter sp. H213]MCM4167331.1 hypothetical protein [Arenibacter sp. H213]